MNPDPKYKLVGTIGLILSIFGGSLSARGIGYLKSGQPYRPDYGQYSKAYQAAPDVPELIGGVPDGKYIYVVRMDRTISYYNREAGSRFPHPNLSRGANVLSAGEMVLQNGQVIELNNHSGHFQPSSLSLVIAKLILQYKGLWHLNGKVDPVPGS